MYVCVSLYISKKKKNKEMVDEEVVLKNPSEAVEEVETLAEEFYNKTLILEKGNINLLVL